MHYPFYLYNLKQIYFDLTLILHMILPIFTISPSFFSLVFSRLVYNIK